MLGRRGHGSKKLTTGENNAVDAEMKELQQNANKELASEEIVDNNSLKTPVPE